MPRPSYSSINHSDGIKFLDTDEKHLLRYLALEDALSSDYLLAEKVVVKRLRNRDIRRASRTLITGIEDDPLAKYIRETPDARNTKLYNRIQRLQFAIGVSQWARRKWGLAVNHGRAVVCAVPAPEASKKSKIDRKIDELYRLINRALDIVGKTEMQRRRFDEVSKKLDKFAEEILGADWRRMRCVNALATAPEFQRRGYGGALLDAVTKLADAEGRSTYLLSSNAAANTEFYNAHGFFIIAEILIGDDDPTWKGPPIPVPLMVRIFGDQ
ncbi:hypothetical protein A7U60_g3243 [Sanghuangporus baumii]|uniref:N-acetyltransferase domain-containing protein n=1 Tax=Sanghuangporus baumii TaxID=108892 RepID=A0A9Q5NAA8_SANBA|nr:hypothetical protein A7U60_g3243 [Sanghuangporus baumii]